MFTSITLIKLYFYLGNLWENLQNVTEENFLVKKKNKIHSKKFTYTCGNSINDYITCLNPLVSNIIILDMNFSNELTLLLIISLLKKNRQL